MKLYDNKFNRKTTADRYFSVMLEKDKIKGIIALLVFGGIGLSFWLYGKEVAKYVAVAGFAIWLTTMYFLNKQGKT